MSDNQDPLAALQQLLDQQQAAGSPSGGAPSDQSVAAEPAAEVPSGPTAEEIQALQEQKTAEDQILIQEQLQKMKTELHDTPQYQARMQQIAAAQEEQSLKALEERSKRIFQLKHLGKK
jgi:hypothetical protein